MHYYLITTHQHGRYLPALFASIEAQYDDCKDFQRRARILVADDASTDDTPAVLERAQASCAGIVVFRHPVNRGVGANRNFLLNWFATLGPAANDFVQFVDGDDLLPPGSLQARLQAFARDPGLQCVGGQLQVFEGMRADRARSVDTFPVDPEVQAIANLFECHFYGANALFRASVFLDPTVRFPETAVSEDWLFFALHPMRKQHVSASTLWYRRHDHNLSSRPASEPDVFDLRRQVRALLLLRIGLLPTARDCELLDLVGYLSFRMQWSGGRFRGRADVHLSWFRYLGARSEVCGRWADVRAELLALFRRITTANDTIPVFQPAKLRTYLAAIVQMAQNEIDAIPVLAAAEVNRAGTAHQPTVLAAAP